MDTDKRNLHCGLCNFFALQWFQFLFFCEDSAPVGQVGVREFPITSHFSPITLVAACRAVFFRGYSVR
jgi:hypothetical protein